MLAKEVMFRSRRVVTPGGIVPAVVRTRGGIIAAVDPWDARDNGAPMVDAGDLVILPGLVDTHVHIDEPGRTAWEGFETATRAAAAGGVTTLIDMPLNSIPATTTVKAYRAKRDTARARCFVDVGFWGGVVPGNGVELAALYDEGAFGFKCFLVPSGVDEFPAVTEGDLRSALPELARIGATLLAHAELPDPIVNATAALARDGSRSAREYDSYLRSRPPAAEMEAIALLIALGREIGTRIHIVHLATAAALPMVRAARASGVPITIETCPHYLEFAAEDVPDGATVYKCAPPIRGRANRELLWRALDDGTIDLVASDHSPCPPERRCMASGDFFAAWGGIASLQLGLSVVWRGARDRGISFARIVEWMAAAPARLARLESRKGTIAPGRDADIVIWNPDAEYTVEPSMLQHRHKVTPYMGLTLPGVVEQTYLRGELVYDRGAFPAGPIGRVLRRGHP